MVDIIDVRDLPEEQASLIKEFVEFLRRKLKTGQLMNEEEEKGEWAQLALTSFAEDWENDNDALYDRWKEHYHVQ